MRVCVHGFMSVYVCVFMCTYTCSCSPVFAKTHLTFTLRVSAFLQSEDMLAGLHLFKGLFEG